MLPKNIIQIVIAPKCNRKINNDYMYISKWSQPYIFMSCDELYFVHCTLVSMVFR